MKELDQIVLIYVIIFVTNIILIVLFIGLYYASPNNYLIVENPNVSNTESESEYIKHIVVEPHEQVQITELSNKLYSVSNQVVCIFKTRFKAQQLVLSPNTWIKPNVGIDGEFYIRNNSDQTVYVTSVIMY